MKAHINNEDVLVIDGETKTECFALRCWIEKNPVSENDGLKLRLNCLPAEEILLKGTKNA